ncbi:MAG: LysR family transcriptional regulator [Comamonadaceae bacterium]|nr:LysR family transcriptional regulator [Comamonadaceae bacterium]
MAWDDIRFFLALARGGSLSAAARALEVEHSTVARRVEQLEARLRVRLFDRLARGWTLTGEGAALRERAEAVELEVLALERAAAGVELLAGTVTVSAPPVLLSRLLVPVLRAFAAAYSQVTLHLVGERRQAQMLRAEADLALRLGYPTEPDLVARQLGVLRYRLYGTAQQVACPAHEQAFIGFDDSMPGLPQQQWLEACVGARRWSLRSNDMEAMVQAAVAGWGLALLPDSVARGHPGLQALPGADPAWVRPVFLVMHADLRRARRVRLAADWIAAHWEDAPPG